jgi:hypothetical protein
MKQKRVSPESARKYASLARRYSGHAALALLLAVSACSDLTGPGEGPDAEQTVVANGPALGGLIAGESARVLPTVTKDAAHDELTASLDQLSSALQAGLGNESRAAIARFNLVIDQFENPTSNPDIAAELAALRHAVDVVREAVETR